MALLFAPLRLWGGGEAMAMPHHAPAAMAADCHDSAPADPDDSGARSADCMTACSVVAPGDGLVLADRAAPARVYRVMPASGFRGTRPESDPPPPRRS